MTVLYIAKQQIWQVKETIRWPIQPVVNVICYVYINGRFPFNSKNNTFTEHPKSKIIHG